jgi:hypothetical protein
MADHDLLHEMCSVFPRFLHILHIHREEILCKITKRKICKLFIKEPLVRNTAPLKSTGIGESENFFLRIFNSFCVFREYAESISAYMENTVN